MTQKIIKIGTSGGVILSKPILEKMGVKIGDQVDIDLERKENKIIITPLNKNINNDEKVAQIALNIINRYKKDFTNLADR